jgi:ubiquinone/menaquinone biosynthesis C-methylase UbiE
VLSTSIHCINSDSWINAYERTLFGLPWRLFNFFNNHWLPNSTETNLNLTRFVADTSDEFWHMVDITASPSRKLCDLFWLQLPWEKIKKELGNINVFDTGCGAGDYAVKLSSFSDGRINNYTGVDVSSHPVWTALTTSSQSIKFHVSSYTNVLEHLPDDANLIMTQSAIEHFKMDLLYFEQIREYIRVNPARSTLQIHLFPSSVCLKLYKYHGVRQYTPRTISKIVKMFDEFSTARLFSLGGGSCNNLHWKYITYPFYYNKLGDLREVQVESYDKELREAVTADNLTSVNSPAFYALVIHSNPRQNLFKASSDAR